MWQIPLALIGAASRQVQASSPPPSKMLEHVVFAPTRVERGVDHLPVLTLEARKGFDEISAHQPRDLADGFYVYSNAVIALRTLNVGLARELMTQAQDYLRKAGKFTQRFEYLIDLIQPEVLFLQAAQKLLELDFDAALIEEASQAATKAVTNFDKETSAYFFLSGYAYFLKAYYKVARIIRDFNQFSFDRIASEIDLTSDALRARDLWAKCEISNPTQKSQIHCNNGNVELLELMGHLAPMMTMVLNATFTPDPNAFDSLRQKIRRAHEAFGQAGTYALPYIRWCDQLVDQINNLERLTRPKTIETTDVIVLVHGIRTFANWEASLQAEFKGAGLEVESTNYEYYDVVRFLLPWQRSRRKAIDRVWLQIRSVLVLHPGARISILAHSFGTYIIAEILKAQFDFRVHRLIFCGSIVPSTFPFHEIMGQIEARSIINDVGGRDVWPALADSVTKGYGHTGTYGFRIPWVRDRWHNRFRHSTFLTTDFCRTFWTPFFLRGTVVDGDANPESPPLWLRSVSVFKIKYVGPLVLLAVLQWQMWAMWPELRARVDALRTSVIWDQQLSTASTKPVTILPLEGRPDSGKLPNSPRGSSLHSRFRRGQVRHPHPSGAKVGPPGVGLLQFRGRGTDRHCCAARSGRHSSSVQTGL